MRRGWWLLSANAESYNTGRTDSSKNDDYNGSGYVARSHPFAVYRWLKCIDRIKQIGDMMAKCSLCNSRKGKRKCLNTDVLICSLCCGTTRTEEACSACSFYQKPKRKYGEVPAYSVSEMDGNMELESYGNSIEGALCAYDIENGNKLQDSDAIRIVELLIDKYYFQDMQIDQENQITVNGFNYVDKAINKDLKKVAVEKIVKVLGVIRFVARRRTKTGREYMTVIHQYVGQRVAPGIRVLQK